MLSRYERLVVVCALLAPLFLVLRKRRFCFWSTLSVLSSVAGLALLLVTPALEPLAAPPYAPLPESFAPDRENKNTMAAVSTAPVPATAPRPEAPPGAAADPVPAEQRAEPERDTEDPFQPWDVIAVHSGSPSYARFAAQRYANVKPDRAVSEMTERLAPPVMARSRLSRVVPRPSYSGYRDATGSSTAISTL
jgi:hypothetical protein